MTPVNQDQHDGALIGSQGAVSPAEIVSGGLSNDVRSIGQLPKDGYKSDPHLPRTDGGLSLRWDWARKPVLACGGESHGQARKQLRNPDSSTRNRQCHLVD